MSRSFHIINHCAFVVMAISCGACATAADSQDGVQTQAVSAPADSSETSESTAAWRASVVASMASAAEVEIPDAGAKPEVAKPDLSPKAIELQPIHYDPNAYPRASGHDPVTKTATVAICNPADDSANSVCSELPGGAGARLMHCTNGAVPEHCTRVHAKFPRGQFDACCR